MAEGGALFPVAEFEARVARMQSLMQAANQDAVLLTSPADVFYVTGFLTRFWESPARPWFVLVPATGAPIAVIPAIGAELMARNWLTDVRTWDAPNPDDDGVSLLCDAICSLVPLGGQLGIPMGLETHLRMPLADYMACLTKIAPRSVVDATDTVHRTREIKSAAEIAKIKTTCEIADRAFDRVATFAHAGQPLDAVFRDFQIALLSEGADWVSYVAGGAGQGGYGDVISPASTEPLQRGDILMLDTGAVRAGYFCDFDRNYAIGTPNDAARRAYDVAFQATEAALFAMQPGMTAADLHGIMTHSILSQGAQPCGGRLGHGLGVTLTEWPSLTAVDQTPLRAGMVLTLEPGVGITPGKIMVHEENIVLTPTGAQLLSRRAPDELPEIHI
jgi:Xaa-Pro aminopeptidase